MISFKQINANRRNARKSTGPTTEEGKQRSRCNAVRHGLTAETVIGALEDAEDHKAFEAAIIADYDAQSAVERELALRLASLMWRLRRATTMETGLFEIQAEQGSKSTSGCRCAPNTFTRTPPNHPLNIGTANKPAPRLPLGDLVRQRPTAANTSDEPRWHLQNESGGRTRRPVVLKPRVFALLRQQLHRAASRPLSTWAAINRPCAARPLEDHHLRCWPTQARDGRALGT